MNNGNNYKTNSIKKVKQYYFVKEIGKGVSATVYLGVNSNKDEIVAIKSIPVEKLEKNNGEINLKRELSNLHKLKHKNIVKIKDFEATKRNRYLIIEYCNGKSLYEFQQYYINKYKTQLNEFFIQKIMRQISEGLEYMHSQKIIHRDIKLENILLNFNKFSNFATKGILPPEIDYDKITLNDSFTIKIADLGYSKEVTSSNLRATILGTPQNMSPDIIKNFDQNSNIKGYNSSIDLWSLGTITYQLLTGTAPFFGKNMKELFQKILDGKYSLPSNLKVSIELITFINGLLQYYPEKRLNWEQIKSHPFLTKNVNNFTFIELNQLDNKNIEMNSKDYDNLLWIIFEGKGLNLPLDKINYKDNISKNKLKESLKNSLKNSIIDNEEIKNAIIEEKKKIEEDKKRLIKEKIEVEKLKKEAEETKKEAELIKEKNEKMKQKIEEIKIQKIELEKQLKQKNDIEQKNNHIIEKKLNDCYKLIKKAEIEKKEYEDKLENAKKLLIQGEIINEKIDNDLKTIKENEDLEEKNRKNNEKLIEIKKQKLIKKEIEYDKKIEDIKNKLNEKELNKYKEEEKKLQNLKNEIKNEVNNIKINIFDENENEIEQQNNKEDIKISNLNINENIQKNENDINFDDWVFYNGESDSKSVDLENENKNIQDDFEIISYQNQEEIEKEIKKLEI